MKLYHQKSYFLIVLLFSSFLLISCKNKPKEPNNQEGINRLISYVKNKEGFKYKIIDTIKYKGANLYRIKMSSGEWMSDKVKGESNWQHWLDIVIPDNIDTNKSLLFIGPGSKYDDEIYLESLSIENAIKTKSIVSHISNIPYQPIKFISNDTIDRYEDDLIAYGWNKFLNGGANDEDAEWLLRFPMTRAVVRAMDVVQEISSTKSKPVNSFFISGASKRGWTTWTTAAVDKRVIGMAPLVIDLLNIVPSFEHHYRLYGDWSPAVEDYVNYSIMDWMNTKEFKKLLSYVEPYEFKSLFNMPKLVINGTIDEFFATDSWKFYWNEIPEKKYLQYVPNGNHGLLGSYQNQNIFSFYERLIYSKDLPELEWSIENGSFNIKVEKNIPHTVGLWKINNPKSRDFRIWEVGRNWEKKEIGTSDSGIYKIDVPKGDGYTASLVEIVFYPDSDSPLTLTTGTSISPDKYDHQPYQTSLK